MGEDGIKLHERSGDVETIVVLFETINKYSVTYIVKACYICVYTDYLKSGKTCFKCYEYIQNLFQTLIICK
jgi:hypothetical protein